MLLAALLCMVRCSNVDSNPTGELALRVPEYSVDGGISTHSVVFTLSALLGVSFINAPVSKESFAAFQEMVVVFMGTYLGASHVVYSVLSVLGILSWVILAGCILAAAASANKDARLLFLAAVCAYITTYYSVLVFRTASLFKASVLGAILFVVYLVFGSMKDRLLVSVSKAGLTGLCLVAALDVWGLSLLGGMHDTNGASGMLFGFVVAGPIICISFAVVFVANFYPAWTERVAKPKEQAPEPEK